jgi:hypothetical protein
VKDVVTTEPVVVVEIQCKRVLASRGDEATDGQEYRDPAAKEQRHAVTPLCASSSRAVGVQTLRQRFDAPPKMPPDGDRPYDLVYLELALRPRMK